MKRFHTLVFGFLLCCLSLAAQAHKPSDSYLSLNVNGQAIQGQWDIALRDLDFAIGLDADGDGKLTWDEVRAKHREIAAFALSHLGISSAEARCTTEVKAQLIDDHTDGAYSVLRFDASCPKPITQLTVEYRLLFDLDPQHKGLLKLQSPTFTTTAIFSPATSKQVFLLAQPSRMRQFIDFVVTGAWHIWLGFDHILFLLSLLLPSVLVWKDRRWQPAMHIGTASFEVLKIVSAFTLAHSITLTLATLQVIALPSRWVESAIALSVVFAALNNMYPLVLTRRWVVAFGFGLIHGFGFASALSDLNLPQATLLLALVGFNVGVEAGQLAVVLVFMPLAYSMRRSWLYQRLVLMGGSFCVALVASVWLVERVFNLKIITP
jgi:hypothetical protein